ncbi:hypothetical protein [Nannocystis sp.]|uniref:hypothetical protein n=1 Tax=Nannocystis sp. TaxID=1962667 RepID=UPI0025E0FE79|nr:hypothetical protein [Nannocystis sp.]MBK7825677.1 hypothetical protein [Nannocystis sp.]
MSEVLADTAALRLATLARARLSGRRLVAVSIGPGQLAGLTAFAAELVGVIAVVPAGGPQLPLGTGGDGPPLLWLVGASRDIFSHVVDEFAATLVRARVAVAAFLAQIDPDAQATVIAYLPVPQDIFGARPLWAQDAALCRSLEDKACAALPTVLPTPPSVPLRWPCTAASWAAMQAKLGAATLVVQALGLSGGGAGTRVCEDFAAAQARLPALGPGPLRAAAWVRGEPCNVMGLVTGDREVLALPPSRQLVATDERGCPGYAGNRFEAADFSAEEREAIAGELRRCGQMLAQRGFHGPFGLDFLRVDASTRVYHDLNPRMNGAAGLLAEIVADAEPRRASPLLSQPERASPLPAVPLSQPELASALPAVLLSRPRLAGELRALEDALVAAVAARPRWRWFLAATLPAPRTIATVPPAGRWHIAPVGPVLRWCGPDGALDDEHASLAVTLVGGVTLAAGDRVVLGDLSCTPALGRALLAAHGERAAALLLAAMFHATCPKDQPWT